MYIGKNVSAHGFRSKAALEDVTSDFHAPLGTKLRLVALVDVTAPTPDTVN